ncbi:hypothetical protein P154DRAFT_447629 [Amniculicola lignicola CBS 123094]|uniref:Uncharacterized protein n=1 Tax=Amniculicola lignicola CBS 123094 TaxID=1392246 RepID=A0A6A5VZS8_9PLEO|nr:hypothetical protein P154DRAFT_447629 [Amniculicola lignicola CBS 123094]
MAFLKDISTKFWSYVSPRKTQQRRDKPFKIPPKPVHLPRKPVPGITSSSDGEMSPDSRVRNWHVRTPSPSRSTILPTTEASRSPPTSPERPYTDYAGDTLIDGLVDALADEDAFDANEDTVVVDDGTFHQDVAKHFDPQGELERRREQGDGLRAAGWSEDTVALFQKLGMRGFEPLFLHSWIDDFGSLPTNLFTRNADYAYIKPMYESDFRAQRALEDLFSLGGRARDAVQENAPQRTAEWHIRQHVKKYNKWALKDGDIERQWNDISLFDIVSGTKHVEAKELEQKMLRKLDRLAALWRDGFRIRHMENANGGKEESVTIPDVPTLYGVITSHTIMAFVAFDVHAPTRTLRTVAIFDFSSEKYDVWNSVAVAIFVIHCRNLLLEYQDDLPEAEVVESEDPDL